MSFEEQPLHFLTIPSPFSSEEGPPILKRLRLKNEWNGEKQRLLNSITLESHNVDNVLREYTQFSLQYASTLRQTGVSLEEVMRTFYAQVYGTFVDLVPVEKGKTFRQERIAYSQLTDRFDIATKAARSILADPHGPEHVIDILTTHPTSVTLYQEIDPFQQAVASLESSEQNYINRILLYESIQRLTNSQNTVPKIPELEPSLSDFYKVISGNYAQVMEQLASIPVPLERAPTYRLIQNKNEIFSRHSQIVEDLDTG
jgi:hypothetical protein